MSSLIRRSFNILKCIELKPIITISNISIHSNSYRTLSKRQLKPYIQLIRAQSLSSSPPENHVIIEKFTENNVMNSKNENNSDLTETSIQVMEVDNRSTLNVTRERINDKIQDFWTKNDITVHGTDAPLPVLDMSSYEWPDSVKSALIADGFLEPTPIQSQGWPIVLSGRDMVGVAQTGSGKTLCYVLPAFAKILKTGLSRGPKCLILAPTRELAQQIQSVVRRYRFANNVCLYGGASRGPQMNALTNNNPQIIIATPGRMIDFVECGAVDLRTVDYLVLDEADRMLDMGFEPQIRKIIDQIPTERQTVMWSATWPKEVKELAAHYMRDYIQINVGGTELQANKNIEQIVEICEEFDKKRLLFELLGKIRADLRQNKTLIFAKTKQTVDYLTNQMQINGWPGICIHGDKSQLVRDRTLNDFRTGRFPILVATDVAARGLDVDDIKFVINYDYPNTGEDYVHRIGRTGRLDKKGTAFTFLTSTDGKQANELIEVLRESNQTVKPELLEMANMSRNMANLNKRQRYGTVGSGGYGYQNRGYQNNSYVRNNYNNGGQQQQQRQQRPGGYSGYGQSNYGNRGGQSYGGQASGYSSNYGSNYNSNYESSRGSGAPYNDY